jgi:hypothetical protein
MILFSFNLEAAAYSEAMLEENASVFLQKNTYQDSQER